MPTLELSEEELQGLVHICATASGPGVSWMLTNALLTKARVAQEAAQGRPNEFRTPDKPGNSEDHDAAVSRA